MEIRVLAIRTDFEHHGEDHGYKQILKGIQPVHTLGIDERHPDPNLPERFKKYQWLFEFSGKKFKEDVDVVHVLYGEDYYRWGARIFRPKPVVATFHQPADMLEKEVLHGSLRGRVGRLTHVLTKDRFRQLAAAIVTSESQKHVLAQVMPAEKIHVISLGVYLDDLNRQFRERTISERNRPIVITVGHWLRDWEYYFQLVEANPQWDFHLINRKLDVAYRKRAEGIAHLTYYSDVTNAEMDRRVLEADLHFLPVTGVAASNAIVHAWALGCPLVITRVTEGGEFNDPDLPFIRSHKPGDVADGAAQIEAFLSLPADEQKRLQEKANTHAQQYSWDAVIQKTIDVYKTCLK